MTVHVLGNSGPIDEISKICKRKKIILIEDTCESLGALYKNKKLGTFGDFGTYSFYYSHQITSGEGGMIVCNNFADYQLIHSMRSHGWSRGIKIDAYEKKKYQHLDNKFLFINSGFNVRPLDITASIANNQLKRINKFIKIRKENREKIIGKLKSSKFWDNQFEFLKPSKNVSPSWFGLPMLISNKYLNNKKKFLKFLDKNNIENRPIISGNFLNQPCIDLYNFKYKKNNFVGSQAIEDRGFFIGLHTKKISEKELDLLENKLMKISKF